MLTTPKVLAQCDTLFTLAMPLGLGSSVVRWRFETTLNPVGPLVTVVTGLHGDELDGGYICYRLAHFLQNLPPGWQLKGRVELIPNANPLGINLSERFVGFSDSDLNRTFPGSLSGGTEEQLAQALLQAVLPAQVCIDIHSSNDFLLEVPQVRVADRPRLKNLAQELGLDLVWTHSTQNWIAGTLAKALFDQQVHCLVVELGAARRLHQLWSERVVQGILHLWVRLGVLQVESRLPPLAGSRVGDENNVFYLTAPKAGVLLLESGVQAGMEVQAGQKIAQVINPTALTHMAVYAPVNGYLFTLRIHPLVYEGSLIARVVRG